MHHEQTMNGCTFIN